MSNKNDRISAGSRRKTIATAPGRESRDQADANRVDEGLELSQTEREQMLRDEALQNQLPNPPKRPGTHWFWASMNNQWTPVTWYRRMGYHPVKIEELAGWADANMRGKSGEYAGCITINEMLLMRCDEASYQKFMKIVHHDKPNEEQRTVRGKIDETRETVENEAGVGGLVEEVGSGLQNMDRSARVRHRKFE